MEGQILLARVAAGLNFCNKRVSDEMRRMAFIYAAYSLKDYMKGASKNGCSDAKSRV
jgi:hypothetical protein